MIDKQTLEDFLKQHTNNDAADKFGVDVRTIARWRKKYGLDRETIVLGQHKSLNNVQQDLLTACMLGDGHVGKNNHRFSIGQKESRKDYVGYVYEILHPYSSNMYKDSCSHVSWRMYTISHRVFDEIREAWYEQQNKRIPRSLKLNAFILAHWYLQDGSNNPKKKSVRLSTQSFSLEDVEFLVEVMKRDLSIEATVNFSKQQPTIHVGVNSYLKFIEIVKEYVLWSCFSYKTDVSEYDANTHKKIGVSKLNHDKAKEIRNLYNDGVKVSDIAKIYDVTISSIYNVVNNVTYHQSNNVADVKVIYNPDTTTVIGVSTPSP